MQFLDAVELEWKALAQGMDSSVQTLDIRLDRGQQKLCIELTWSGYVASITAWENATCLDIDVLDLDTKNGIMLVSGSCKDQGDATSRLLQLRDHINASLTTSRHRQHD